MGLIQQRTLLVNQLQQALYEYYPVVLEAFEDWTLESTWDLIIEFPTPQALQQAGRRRWEKFLHAHRLWRQKSAEERLAVFARATEFCGAPATLAAKSLLAVSLAKLLRTLQAQLDQYRQQIQQLFEQHPQHDLFDSLPGAGATLAPRLLGSLGAQPDRFTDPQTLQCLAGTAPVSYQSGQIHKVRLRHQCDKFLRQTVHLWSDCSRKTCVWAQVYYQKKRSEGKSHACALRCLGQRWLKILSKMWQTKSPYDAELHALNQQKHGSWVLTLMAKNPA
jgi:transposase